ncbi:SGNH/GDSL hydrolase family protein [Streptomyces sp. NPDC051555]|uniref:SGNH/GDSL hydrolase family protein n=1 Tax=Streptomyces sp. NPDC051555 TaxID=3365657 RepID=UPI00378D7788
MPPRFALAFAAALLTLAACTPVAAAPGTASLSAPPHALRVMPLGDSITQGVGSSTSAGYRLPLQARLAGRRVDFVGSQHGGAVADPDHEGHSGYMIDQLGAGIDGWLATAQPDVVLLHAGINDLDRGEAPHAADRLIALADRIHADRPRSTVLVLGLIPTTGRLEAEARIVNAKVRDAAGHRYRYVAPPALTPAEMADRLHPNDLGYQRIAAALCDAMTP